MTLVAKPRTIIPKSRFRVELDQIGDLRCTSASAIKMTFQFITTEEGGAATVAEFTVNTHGFEPITVERPLSKDMALAQWAENFRLGKQDLRNGHVYAVDTEGIDIYRWSIEECFLVEFEDGQGDAKAKEEAMMERAVIRYRQRGMREALQ